MRNAVVNALPLPRFGHKYVLQGYEVQMKQLAQDAEGIGLAFAYGEALSPFNWCVATGEKDTVELNAHLASRKPIYDEIQRQLRRLVEDNILDVLLQRAEDAPPVALERSVSDWKIPAARVLQQIQALGLVEKSKALLHPATSFRLKPISDWVEAHYGVKADALPCTRLNAHKAHQAFQRGRFDLINGQFSYEPVSAESVYQTIFQDLFQVKETPRRFRTSKMIPQQARFKLAEMEAKLADKFPAAEPEQLIEHLRAMVRSGLLDQIYTKTEHEYAPTSLGLKAFKAFLHGKASIFGTAPQPVDEPTLSPLQ